MIDHDDHPRTVRLHVDLPLSEGLVIEPSAPQCHYLLTVMRRNDGDHAMVFNGEDGEWQARIGVHERRRCRLELERLVRPQQPEPGPALLFAPLKRIRQEFLIEKATELGVAVFVPVFCRRSVVGRINRNRLLTIAIEAAEQCGRLSIPGVEDAMTLTDRLGALAPGRRLYVCDATGKGTPLVDAIDEHGVGDIMIGPEGGFDPEELEELSAVEEVVTVDLGPRTLRAETAALAALACYQALIEADYEEEPEAVEA